MSQNTQPSAPVRKLDEQILVVKTSHLFKEERWQGLKEDNLSSFFELVRENQEFHPRSAMETNPSYKQIIPYLIFTHENNYFLMQRKSSASEQRLKNKHSLGIGGHIRQEDMEHTSIMGWAEREFHEEIAYIGSYTVKPLGILNDDSNLVGEVHIGCVLLIEGNSSNISIKSELKEGRLLSLDECHQYYDQMEGWSQIVFNLLKSRTKK